MNDTTYPLEESVQSAKYYLPKRSSPRSTNGNREWGPENTGPEQLLSLGLEGEIHDEANIIKTLSTCLQSHCHIQEKRSAVDSEQEGFRGGGAGAEDASG